MSSEVWDAGICVICTRPIEVEGFNSKKLLKANCGNTYEQTCAECDPALRCSWWNPGCNCLWSCIPDDVMVTRVFCYLDVRELAVYSRVCRRWASLCQTTALYKSLDLTQVGKCHPYSKTGCSQSRESDALVGTLKRHGQTALSTIKLCGVQRLTPASLTAMAQLARNLQELHFCNNLTLEDTSVISIIQNCHNLQNLQCPGCLFLTDEALARTAHSQLQVLNIARCKFTTRGLQRMCDGAGRLASTLRSLNIARCPNLNAAAMAIIGNALRSLEELNVHSVELDGEALRALVKGCGSLRSLDISGDAFFGNDSISDDDLTCLAGLPKLRSLDMEGFTQVTHSGITNLITSLGSLETLNVAGCASILFTDQLHSALESSYLHGLTLSGTDADDGTILALSRLPLRTLDMNGCHQLTSDVIDLFARTFPNLKKLDIGLCSGIEAHRLAWLRKQRPDLKITHY